MAALEQNINQAGLTQLARREHFTFFGLTLPYLVLVGAMIIIPIGWLFFLSFIGRDGSFSFASLACCAKQERCAAPREPRHAQPRTRPSLVPSVLQI